MLKYDCKFCGRKHPATKENCPAYGKECHKCGQENHYSNFCPKKKKVQSLNHTGGNSDESDRDDDQEAWLGAVQSSGRSTMVVNGCDVNFEIDSGAEVRGAFSKSGC